jgi:hypothetical protein
MTRLELYVGPNPLGCRLQVHRAKTEYQEIEQLANSESTILMPMSWASYPSSTSGDNCRCRISENGCIDPSLCIAEHGSSAIPHLNRWCGMSVDQMSGVTYLHFFSGWGMPGAMKLLGRWPTKRAFLDLLDTRTDRRISHRNSKCRAELRFANGGGLIKLTLDSAGSKLFVVLMDIPDHWRIE